MPRSRAGIDSGPSRSKFCRALMPSAPRSLPTSASMKRSMRVSRFFSSSSVSLGRLGADGWGARGDLFVVVSGASRTVAMSAHKIPIDVAHRQKALNLSHLRVYTCWGAGSMRQKKEIVRGIRTRTVCADLRGSENEDEWVGGAWLLLLASDFFCFDPRRSAHAVRVRSPR